MFSSYTGEGGFVSDYGEDANSAGGGFSDGGFLAGATQDALGGDGSFNADRRRGNDGQKIHPLKISIVLKSVNENPQEHRVKFFDDDVTMFKLVGMVRNLQIEERSEKWSFTLDDGAGMINVEWLAQRQRDFNEFEPSDWLKSQQALVQENTYVRVFGDLNLLGKSEPHISAFFLSSIEVPEEIFYHDTQVAQVLVSKLFPNSKPPPTTNAAAAMSSYSTPSPFSNIAPSSSRFLQGGYPPPTTDFGGFGTTPAAPPTVSKISAPAPAASFYGSAASVPAAPIRPLAQRNSVEQKKLSSAIIEICRNISSLRPAGLSTDDLCMQLVGRGLGKQQRLMAFSSQQ